MKKLLVGLFLVSVFVGGWYQTSAHPSTLPQDETMTRVITGIIAAKDTPELIVDSGLIVRGTVKDILPSKVVSPTSGQPDLVVTDVIVSVDETFKGTALKQVTVRLKKGRTGNSIVISHGYPDFVVGEETLLFLAKDDGDTSTSEDYLILTGMIQGKFSRVIDGPEGNATNGLVGNRFTSVREEIRMDTFGEQVRKILDEAIKNPKPKLDPKAYQP